MLVSFKNISNKVNKYEVNPEDNLSSVVSKLLEDNKIDPDKNTIKFIFKGQILNHGKLFSEFTEENPVIIFMVSKIKPEVVPKTTSDTVSVNSISNYVVQTFQSVNTSNQSNNTSNSVNVQPLPNLFNQPYNSEPEENLDSVDKLRAAVMGVLVFIRANPQLAKLFNNDFETLMGVMASNQIRPLFEKMVSETGEGDSGYLDELSETLMNVNSDEQSVETTNQTPPPNSIQLSQDDMNNINTLVSLGFSKQDVIHTYIICNKNMAMTASMLMDS